MSLLYIGRDHVITQLQVQIFCWWILLIIWHQSILYNMKMTAPDTDTWIKYCSYLGIFHMIILSRGNVWLIQIYAAYNGHACIFYQAIWYRNKLTPVQVVFTGALMIKLSINDISHFSHVFRVWHLFFSPFDKLEIVHHNLLVIWYFLLDKSVGFMYKLYKFVMKLTITTWQYGQPW